MNFIENIKLSQMRININRIKYLYWISKSNQKDTVKKIDYEVDYEVEYHQNTNFHNYSNNQQYHHNQNDYNQWA